jgi:hypothetical protein
MDHVHDTLTIVIPALDEEEAIGSTIRRCLDARPRIIDHGGVAAVEVIVVSDGSSDRTEEIALASPEVTVLAFDRNRGYGAAIRCGFEHASGSLVGFLDADGTCDPEFFASLCPTLAREHADVVLGSRMGPHSRMPWIRSVGNTLFAWMLGILAQRAVRDTASGMRVIRRSSLERLYPLPDGLHFTPAMSARALLDDRLTLVEVPMAYAERTGRSKLSPVADGVRFLTAILRAAICLRPARPLLLAAAASSLAALLVGLGPLLFYLRWARLEEWMIYRILLASLLATLSGLLATTAVVADRIAALAHDRAAPQGVTGALARLVFSRRGVLVGGPLVGIAAVVLVWPGIVEYLVTGHVVMHWSRAVLAALLLVLVAMQLTSALVLGMIDLMRRDSRAGDPVKPPDRVRPAAASAPGISATT